MSSEQMHADGIPSPEDPSNQMQFAWEIQTKVLLCGLYTTGKILTSMTWMAELSQRMRTRN